MAVTMINSTFLGTVFFALRDLVSVLTVIELEDNQDTQENTSTEDSSIKKEDITLEDSKEAFESVEITLEDVAADTK